jgi:hypothetical protein
MPCPSVTLYLEFKLGIQFKPDQNFCIGLCPAWQRICQIFSEAVPQPWLKWGHVSTTAQGHVVDLLKEQTCSFILDSMCAAVLNIAERKR